MKLQKDFYQREDVLTISRELLGKVLCTQFEGELTSGIIVETEAYAGETDQASHTYGGRRTLRTEVMYAPGGVSYIYLCYGIHHLFNVVTNFEGIPHAILIRAIKPIDGIDIMGWNMYMTLDDAARGLLIFEDLEKKNWYEDSQNYTFYAPLDNQPIFKDDWSYDGYLNKLKNEK